MAEISAAAVKALREKTDLPMMACKQALQEAGGDEAQAMEILRGQVGKLIEKRGANVTEEGRIFVVTADDGSQLALVEMQCESAPVAGSEGFRELGEAFAREVLTGPPAASVDDLMQRPAPGGSGTLKELYEEQLNKIREKLVVGRFARLGGPAGVYVHHDGKTAAVFQAEGDIDPDAPVLRDIAMHIAAMKPDVTHVDELDPAVVESERRRLAEEARATGKPDNIIEKIVDGRMGVFYREQAGVLTEQPFAKEDSKSVSQVLAEHGLKAKGFVLWILGQSDS